MRAAALASLLALTSACSDWREKVTPGLAVAEPTQTPVPPSERTIDAPLGRATLHARARYAIRAWVVATDDTFDDLWTDVAVLDLSLAWGPVASPAVLGTMTFHLKRRYVSARWSGEMPLDLRTVMRHLSNHHLIPSSPEVLKELRRAKPGDLVTLEGLLVDVERSGRTMKTSLSRDDIGDGACEILWVERAKVERPR